MTKLHLGALHTMRDHTKLQETFKRENFNERILQQTQTQGEWPSASIGWGDWTEEGEKNSNKQTACCKHTGPELDIIEV